VRRGLLALACAAGAAFAMGCVMELSPKPVVQKRGVGVMADADASPTSTPTSTDASTEAPPK